MRPHHLSLAAVSLSSLVLTKPLSSRGIYFKGPIQVESDSLHNIHIGYANDVEGEVRVVYGDCDMSAEHERHHHIAVTTLDNISRPDRLVWIVPRDIPSDGCLHAFSNDRLVGRSGVIGVSEPLRKRQVISDVADAEGPWFDGVAYMESNNISATSSAAAKAKKIAIVGGGMSGLLTSLLLDSVGIHNWHITESTQRVGGRIRTKYLNNTRPDQYQYQEMGPMRFPVTVKYAGTNETFEINDHKMVFQLADYVNKLNNYDPALNVTFIPWIQSSANDPADSNGVRLPNGRVPSLAQIAANSSLAGPSYTSENPDLAAKAVDEVDKFVGLTPDRMKEIATNVYKAHKESVERGHFHWSEANYLRYALGLDANLTDFIDGASDFAPMWAYDTVYFSATTWRTINKGLESLPLAIKPHVANRTTFGRKIDGIVYNSTSDKIALTWRDDPMSMTPKSEEYDYAIIAVPFSKVRGWKLPRYSSLLSRAIETMNYDQSCKISLLYKSRFWEKLSPPIIGGCGSVDVYGVGSVCYPSYAINSSGPGVLLGSYTSGTPCRTMASLSEEDHVALVQRTMVEIHGQVAADEYTGVYERQLWEIDEHQAGAWADPLVGQQDLFLPAYYNTEMKTIFVGEHTSYTHAWIFSALDSAVRGTTQLLLDLGLVDEAKFVVNEWMGRWITV